MSAQIARLAAWLGLALLASLLPAAAWAHGGGTPRLTASPAGPYRVYAWSEPEPWRAGEVHLSLAVTLPGDGTETPVTDAQLAVTFTPAADPQGQFVVQATRQSALNDYYYEADTELPAAGDWQITIAVNGPAGSGSTGFDISAAPPRTLNWTLVIGGAGILMILVTLMGLWARRRPANPAPARPGQRRRDEQVRQL
jgi:hypothetical protein